MMIEFEKYFLAATQSVGTATTLAGAGFYFHRRILMKQKVVIDDTAGKKMLALISQQVTIPALLFTKIVYCPPPPTTAIEDSFCPSLIDYLEDIWMVALFPIYVVTCGLIVGRIAAFVSNTPSRQVKTAMAACAFANSTGLPITLLTVVHSNFPLTTEIGKNDPTLFLSMYLLLYPILQWGIGGWLLAPHQEDNDNHDADAAKKTHCKSNNNNAIVVPNISTFEYDKQSDSDDDDDENDDIESNATDEDDEKRNLIAFPLERRNSVPYASHSDHQPLNKEEAINQGHDCEAINKHNHAPITEESSYYINLIRPLLLISSESKIVCYVPLVVLPIVSTMRKILINSLQPPVIAAISGIIVSSIPDLRALFVNTTNQTERAPLEWLFNGLRLTGQAAVPINMIILGINLSKTFCTSDSKTGRKNLLSIRTTIAIIMGKMIVMPIIGFITCLLLKNYLLQLPDEIDGTIYLVLMIVFITPTANNVMVMVELSGSASKEGMARLIGWQYVFAPLVLSVNVAIVVSLACQW